MTEGLIDDMFSTACNIPDELNKHLQDRVIVLVQENSLLQKNIHKAEERILRLEAEANELRKKLEAVENPLLPASFTASSQNINGKIVELSKNYREKCAELEKYKTKCSKLVAHIESLKKKNEEPTPAIDTKTTDNKTSQESLLQEKLNAVTNKMLELKNVNLLLRNDLRQANKLLQQETGITDLNELKNGVLWKGRAEIICELQEKNKKLKEKLRHFLDGTTSEAEIGSSERVPSKTLLLEKENADLKRQIEIIKNKNEISKSRCQMLEVECQSLKSSLRDLKEKNAADFVEITNLSRQLSEAETVKRCAVKEKDIELGKLNLHIQNLEAQVQTYKTVLEKMKIENQTKQAKVELPLGVNLNVKDLQQNLESLEKEKVKLLELLNTYKTKLEVERNEHDKCRQQYRLERQKTVKLEGAAATSELEALMTNRSRYSNISQSSRVMDKNLTYQLVVANETIKTLRARIDVEKEERKRDFDEFYKILSVRNKKDSV